MRTFVAYASGLLHVVGHHDHRVVTLEFNGRAPRCALWTIGSSDARSLIHKQHLRLNRQRASDAQTLLLAARKRKGAPLQTVFQLRRKSPPCEARFRRFRRASALPLTPWVRGPNATLSYTLIGNGLRFLEHHANTSAKQVDVDFLAVEFFPIEPDRAFDSAAFDSVVHAIEAAQEGRLSAARWANERGNLIARHVHRYAVKRMERAIVQIEV